MRVNIIYRVRILKLIYDGTFLYGMTAFGGNTFCSGGCGVIFKVEPNGANYTRLAYFMGGNNGFTPGGSLISDGTYLYGMTYVATELSLK